MFKFATKSVECNIQNIQEWHRVPYKKYTHESFAECTGVSKVMKVSGLAAKAFDLRLNGHEFDSHRLQVL